MTKRWPMARLGDVLQERNETPDATSLSSGRTKIVSKIGFEDGRIELRPGSESRTGLILVRPGDLVLSGINAAKGAVAVYDDENTAPIAATIHYGAYEVDRRRAIANYLWWYLRTPRFREAIVRSLPNGIKTEVKSRRLLPLEIPLPPIDEQRRLVRDLEALSSRVALGRDLLASIDTNLDTFVSATLARVFPQPRGERVSDFVRFQTGFAFKSDWFTQEGIRLVRNVNVGHGRIDWNDAVRIPNDSRGGFKQFELNEGDILVSLDRPIISTGAKVARVTSDDLPSLLLQRVARAILKTDRITGDYFFHWLKSPAFVRGIAPGRSNGIPHISHKEIERIPFAAPSIEAQHRAVRYLDSYTQIVESIRRLQSSSTIDLNALLPAALNRAFGG
jgi:type I restriction enzyme, S subunit